MQEEIEEAREQAKRQAEWRALIARENRRSDLIARAWRQVNAARRITIFSCVAAGVPISDVAADVRLTEAEVREIDAGIQRAVSLQWRDFQSSRGMIPSRIVRTWNELLAWEASAQLENVQVVTP
ncbi:MAG: hypothetical protein EPN98_21600 [Phenylobacterium sp.]|uniref:hypothetical protein n=1 Tax=Phenylobacterium sp. TaxID=1871053 RepID=UPI0012065537|nr:hypothetical protein [Phenylobacterium sp.]TAL29040.1 MAG: hypothetical protein EPN98_21600 [Phenylobacterium sp.]